MSLHNFSNRFKYLCFCLQETSAMFYIEKQTPIITLLSCYQFIKNMYIEFHLSLTVE